MKTHFILRIAQRMRRAFVTTLLTTTCASFSPTVAAQIADIDDAVYKASRQGMLIQRISKCYMLLALDVDKAAAKKILNESVSQFDRHLVELKVFAPTAEIKSVYAKLDAPWASFKEQVLGVSPTAAQALRIEALERPLSQLTVNASELLQRRSSTNSTRLVAIAEANAMHSQRFAMLHFASLLTKSNTPQMELKKIRSDFVGNLDIIKGSRSTPAQILRQIELAEAQWAFLDKAVANRGDEKNRATLSANVFKASERVLELVESIAVALERL